MHYLPRVTSFPSGTAQTEQNNKPMNTPLVPEDQINDIMWKGYKCFVFFSFFGMGGGGEGYSVFISVEDRTGRIRFSYNYSMSFT